MVTTQSVFHGDCVDWMSSHTVWCVGVFLSQFKPWFELVGCIQFQLSLCEAALRQHTHENEERMAV